MAVDLVKAFDSVPVDITFAVCAKLGMNMRILEALKGMYKQIQRRFKIRSFVPTRMRPVGNVPQRIDVSVDCAAGRPRADDQLR